MDLGKEGVPLKVDPPEWVWRIRPTAGVQGFAPPLGRTRTGLDGAEGASGADGASGALPWRNR